jgi:hypothetical protein
MLEIFISYSVKFTTAAKLEGFVRYGSTTKVDTFPTLPEKKASGVLRQSTAAERIW